MTTPAPDGSQQPAPPAYAAAPPAPVGAPTEDPGRTLGIVALVLAFVFTLLGLILGYVARSQSKKAGFDNTPAKIAIILSWIFIALGIVVGIIVSIVYALAIAAAVSHGVSS